ncbi:hypothetical protein SUGI_0308420 [Cryptomeria japonica]|nr:hypothetical protein SUGI_0308420 [Cryptomeria japonica]
MLFVCPLDRSSLFGCCCGCGRGRVDEVVQDEAVVGADCGFCPPFSSSLLFFVVLYRRWRLVVAWGCIDPVLARALGWVLVWMVLFGLGFEQALIPYLVSSMKRIFSALLFGFIVLCLWWEILL